MKIYLQGFENLAGNGVSKKAYNFLKTLKEIELKIYLQGFENLAGNGVSKKAYNFLKTLKEIELGFAK